MFRTSAVDDDYWMLEVIRFVAMHLR